MSWRSYQPSPRSAMGPLQSHRPQIAFRKRLGVRAFVLLFVLVLVFMYAHRRHTGTHLIAFPPRGSSTTAARCLALPGP